MMTLFSFFFTQLYRFDYNNTGIVEETERKWALYSPDNLLNEHTWHNNSKER